MKDGQPTTGRRQYLRLLGLGTIGMAAGCTGFEGLVETNPDEENPSEQSTSTRDASSSTESPSARTRLTEDFKIMGAGVDSESSSFGESATVVGDTLLVGGTSPSPGAVFVFNRTDDRWEQAAQLRPNNTSEYPLLGRAVAYDGRRALIGAQGDADPNGRNAGSAFVLNRDGDDWMVEGKLVASDGADNDLFGSSVAIDGDTVVVGAPGDSHRTISGGGSAYVFARDADGWHEQAKLLGQGGEDIFRFGNSVSIDGDTIVVGATFGEDNDGQRGGWTWVYTRSGNNWTRQARLRADDGDDGDGFGSAVSLDGDTLLVGARTDEDPHGTDNGTAYVFTRQGSSWRQQAKLIPSPCREGTYDQTDKFGTSVSLSGDRAIIGAPGDETINCDEHPGSAYLFTWSGDSWEQQAQLIPSDVADEDKYHEDSTGRNYVGDFGASIGFDGTTAVVGAIGPGTAYVYEL